MEQNKRNTNLLSSDVISFVHVLFVMGSPTAVFLAVIAIIIDSIKRGLISSMLLSVKNVRGFHVFFEDGKIVPFFRNSYTSAAVIDIGGIAWVSSSASHTSPNIVQRILPVLMRAIQIPDLLRPNAPTTCSPSRGKLTPTHGFQDATFATAFPCRVLPSFLSFDGIKANYGQSAYNFPRKVESFHMRTG